MKAAILKGDGVVNERDHHEDCRVSRFEEIQLPGKPYLARSLKSYVFSIDVQTELDHAVNASRKLRRNTQIEARFQHRGDEKGVSEP